MLEFSNLHKASKSGSTRLEIELNSTIEDFYLSFKIYLL